MEFCRYFLVNRTIAYIFCGWIFRFKDVKSKKLHCAQVVLQVCVKPGSYKTEAQTVGANEQIDPKFSNTEVQWSTKEKGATVLTGLLIRVE
jgi:neuralized-like protein 4